LNKDNLQLLDEPTAFHHGEKNPKVIFSGEVECDELYLIAGFKDQQDQVRKGAQRSLDAVETIARAGYIGQRKASYFRHDSTRR